MFRPTGHYRRDQTLYHTDLLNLLSFEYFCDTSNIQIYVSPSKPRVIFNIYYNPKISTVLTQINSDAVASTS